MFRLSKSVGLHTVLFLFLLMGAACGTNTTIAEIQNDPPTYDGQTVTLNGEVTSRLSLVIVRTYNLNDGTGEMTVVTKKALPNVGAQVEVTGRVKEAFSFGSSQSLVLIDESAQEE